MIKKSETFFNSGAYDDGLQHANKTNQSNAGKYQAYTEYTKSGVDWLATRPAEWKITKLKYLIKQLESGVSVNATDLPATGDELGVLKTSCVYTREFRPSENKKVFIEEYRRLKCPARQGEIIISRMNTPDLVGAAALVDSSNKNLFLPDRLWQTVFHEQSACCTKFLHYFMFIRGFRDQISNYAEGASSSMQNIAKEDFLSINVVLPSMTEQLQIANFLDHETAKIDTLIEKQQQLIKLLKEKRQAVISHAVTKGLNPDAPMKDSGVEWLGDVPEHWVVAQLKFNTLEMQTGPFGSQLHAEDYVVDGIPLINPAHMIDGKIIPGQSVTVDNETHERLKRHKLSQGEIIFARRGELGRCAIVTKDEEGWLCGTGSLKAKLNARLIPKYSYLLITSDGVISELSLESKGSTMDNLNTETLGRVRLPVPPVTEQNEILKYVERVSGKYKSLISKAETAIILMQERRTALISAAVTGKIDVRNWQPVPPNTSMEAANE